LYTWNPTTISFPEDYSKQRCARALESYLADALVNAVLGSFKKCILIMYEAGLPLAAIEAAVETHSPTNEKMGRMVAELNDPSLPIQCEEEKGAEKGKRGGERGRNDGEREGGDDEYDSDDGSYDSDDDEEDEEDIPPVFWPMPARVVDRWRVGYRRAEMDARPWKEEGNRLFKASNSKLQPLQLPQQQAMLEKALHCYSKGMYQFAHLVLCTEQLFALACASHPRLGAASPARLLGSGNMTLARTIGGFLSTRCVARQSNQQMGPLSKDDEHDDAPADHGMDKLAVIGTGTGSGSNTSNSNSNSSSNNSNILCRADATSESPQWAFAAVSGYGYGDSPTMRVAAECAGNAALMLLKLGRPKHALKIAKVACTLDRTYQRAYARQKAAYEAEGDRWGVYRIHA
jgi:hypothetical protein